MMHRAVLPLVKSARGSMRLGCYTRGMVSTLALHPHDLIGYEVDAGRDAQSGKHGEGNKAHLAKLATRLSATYFNPSAADFARHKGAPNDIVQLFRLALQEKDIIALHRSYRILREDALLLKESTHATSHTQAESIASIRVEELRAAMQLAAGPPLSFVPRSSRSEKERAEDSLQRRSSSDGKLAQLIFNDLKGVFGFAIENVDCSLALSGFALQRVSPKEALEYLKILSTSFDFRWESGDAAIVMGLCSRTTELSIADELWAMIKETKVRISRRLQDLYLHVLLKSGNVARARDVAFIKGGLNIRNPSQRDMFSYAWFLEGASRAGIAKYRQLRTIANSLLQHLAMPGITSSLFEWHALAIYTSLSRDISSAMELIRKARKDRRIEPDSKTFNILLLCHKEELERIASTGNETDVARLLSDIEGEVGVAPDRYSYSIGISTLLGRPLNIFYRGIKAQERHLLAKSDDVDLRDIISEERLIQPKEIKQERASISIPSFTPGQVYEAQLLYQRFRNTDQLPDNAMLDPLIRALTKSYLPNLNEAMQLYQDLRISYEKGSNEKISREIYDMLLRACADARDAPTAARLIEDMVHDGMTVSPSNAANFATLLIPASTSYESAFQVYEQIRDAAANINRGAYKKQKAGNGQVQTPFDQKGWIHIINIFSKLKFARKDVTPVEMVLSMISDMNKYGMRPDTRLFTTILRFYGYKASDPSSNRDELQISVIELHSYIQRHNIEPDLTLVTALMDAYNRTGLTRQALEIWYRLVLSNTPLDSVCIAVALDTCGHSLKLAEVRKVWRWVQRNPEQAKECNKAVWDAYVEALARSGNLEEAIDIAFGDMRKELESRNDGSKVDAKTMEMLLKFASSKKHWWTFNVNEEYPLLSQLQQRMQTDLPEIWEQVKGSHITRLT